MSRNIDILIPTGKKEVESDGRQKPVKCVGELRKRRGPPSGRVGTEMDGETRVLQYRYNQRKVDRIRSLKTVLWSG